MICALMEPQRSRSFKALAVVCVERRGIDPGLVKGGGERCNIAWEASASQHDVARSTCENLVFMFCGRMLVGGALKRPVAQCATEQCVLEESHQRRSARTQCGPAAGPRPRLRPQDPALTCAWSNSEFIGDWRPAVRAWTFVCTRSRRVPSLGVFALGSTGDIALLSRRRAPQQAVMQQRSGGEYGQPAPALPQHTNSRQHTQQLTTISVRL